MNVINVEDEINDDLPCYSLSSVKWFCTLKAKVNKKKTYLLLKTRATSSLVRTDVVGSTKFKATQVTFKTAAKDQLAIKETVKLSV